MKSQVWVVTKKRTTDDRDFCIILGVYSNFADAVARVDEIFLESEEWFEGYYGELGLDYEADNHHNGYAELTLLADEEQDDVEISAVEYTINKPTYDGINL